MPVQEAAAQNGLGSGEGLPSVTANVINKAVFETIALGMRRLSVDVAQNKVREHFNNRNTSRFLTRPASKAGYFNLKMVQKHRKPSICVPAIRLRR